MPLIVGLGTHFKWLIFGLDEFLHTVAKTFYSGFSNIFFICSLNSLKLFAKQL